jgi:hypothetical protein
MLFILKRIMVKKENHSSVLLSYRKINIASNESVFAIPPPEGSAGCKLISALIFRQENQRHPSPR